MKDLKQNKQKQNLSIQNRARNLSNMMENVRAEANPYAKRKSGSAIYIPKKKKKK